MKKKKKNAVSYQEKIKFRPRIVRVIAQHPSYNYSRALTYCCSFLPWGIISSSLSVVRSREEANDYLRSLSVRANHADELLIKSTEFLLPAMMSSNETPRMTASELSQVFDTLNAVHAQVIDEIECGTQNVWVGSPPSSLQQENVATLHEHHGTVLMSDDENKKTGIPTPHHWSIGMPLPMVTEADYETDRNSYASASSVRSSPKSRSSSSQTPTRGTPGTPSTPNIQALRLR